MQNCTTSYPGPKITNRKGAFAYDTSECWTVHAVYIKVWIKVHEMNSNFWRI